MASSKQPRWLWVGSLAMLGILGCAGGEPTDSPMDESELSLDGAGPTDLSPIPSFRECCAGEGHGYSSSGVSSRDLGSGSDLTVDASVDMCIPPDSCAVTFSYPKGNESMVELAGDFNGWTIVPLSLVGNAWQRTETLADQQTVLYKFLVDGAWTPDPANPDRTHDGYDNSILTVDCPNPCL